MIRSLVCLFLLFAAPLQAAETLRFYGFAYDLKTDRHLYTEVHEQVVEGGRWLRGRIDYYLPDGRRLGSKPLDFSRDPYVPLFRLDLPLSGYQEGISEVDGNAFTLERRDGAQARIERKTLERDGPTCADSGFHAFLVAHFDRLIKGETQNLRLAVAGSLDQFKFRARRVEDTVFENRPAVRFRIEPDSLLRFVVDPLQLTYDPRTKTLLEYRGISNISDPQTGKLYVARIVYPSKPPEDVAKLPPLGS